MKPYEWALAAVAACALAVFAGGTAQAAKLSCTGSGTLAFGDYDVYGGASTFTGSVSGTCKNSTTAITIAITLDNGANVQTDGNRAMACTNCSGTFANDVLQYQLYTTASLTTPWIGTTSVSTAACPCGSSPVAWGPISVFGLIFAAVPGGMNDSAVGHYSDTVVVTVNY